MDAGGAGATRYTQEGSNPLRRDWGSLRSSGAGRRAAQLQEVSDVFLGKDRALQRRQKVQGPCAGDRRRLARQAGGGPPGHCGSHSEDLCLFRNSSGSSGKVCADTSA